MPPATRSVEREEARRLNTRTLTIASVASASAAAVTSQLWIAGTWIAAALTPVLVAVISEAMHRPTERIARAWTASGDGRLPRAVTAAGEGRFARGSSAAGEGRFARKSSAAGEAQGPRAWRAERGAVSPTRGEPAAVTGAPGPVRVYRAGGDSGSGSTLLTKRRVALGTVAATAAIACVIGLLTLTTVDLVSGGSVGKGSGRFTLAGGGKSKSAEQKQNDSSSEQKQQQDSTGNQQNDTQRNQTTAPTESTPTEPPPTNTAPVPPPSETPPGEPVPQTQSP